MAVSAQGSGMLRGVRVLDLTRILAGPFATMQLADMGADVLKVEMPGRGDDTRSWGPPFLGGDSGGMATYFASVNRSKRSVAVDLKHPRGAQAVRSLASKADVVIENFRPGTLDRMGLGYESLSAANKRVVLCSLTGYGQWGPASEAAGYDVSVAAEGGLLSITGEPDGPPVKPGVAVTDMMTGMHAAAAVLAALLEFAALCSALGGSLAGMSDDPRFATNAARVKHREQVVAAVRCELKSGAGGAAVTREDLVRLLRRNGLAASPINSVEEAFETDHARGRRAVVELHHPVAGSVRLPAPAIRAGKRGVDASKGTDGEAVAARWAPPLLGEHTREALADWGACTEDELEAGISEGWLQQAGADRR
ncbi:hypothetical protein FNF28_07363 [Cafeteria roenbergensis]|uniref:Formyl-CoA transferase n=1 Tax=Cafeteria roenbergensis TaxID=33653 RepID=A0A5A8CBA5_CAFRO|nr:hypothetical protein FNF28_07363 [Cafeteria roenbergensis]